METTGLNNVIDGPNNVQLMDSNCNLAMGQTLKP